MTKVQITVELTIDDSKESVDTILSEMDYSFSHIIVEEGVGKQLNEKRIHPCHKPTLLYQKLIADYGFEGCKILDTHVGSGSSRIATAKAGKQFVGFEIDKYYYEAQEKRFKDFVSQLRMF